MFTINEIIGSTGLATTIASGPKTLWEIGSHKPSFTSVMYQRAYWHSLASFSVFNMSWAIYLIKKIDRTGRNAAAQQTWLGNN